MNSGSSQVQCTVVMPCFNARQFISRSIESVLAQTFESWELIVVDDCSTDGSAAYIANKFICDPRIRVESLKKNSGAAVARNRAIQRARGRYIAFLDSDDEWAPNKLEIQLAFMRSYGYSFTFTGYSKVNEKGSHLHEVGVPDKIDYYELLKTNVIGCLTAIYDTQQLGKVYMPLIRKRQDFGLWLRLLKLTPYAYGLNESLAFYTVRDGSVSSNKKDAARYTWKLYREVENLSLIRSAYYFSHYAARGVFRTKFPGLANRLGLLY